MFFNLFDLVIFIFIILCNIYVKKMNRILFTLTLIILFGLLFPFLSTKIDISKIPSDLEIDGFNTVFIKLKWLVYWGIGIVELFFFKIWKFSRKQ